MRELKECAHPSDFFGKAIALAFEEAAFFVHLNRRREGCYKDKMDARCICNGVVYQIMQVVLVLCTHASCARSTPFIVKIRIQIGAPECA